MVIAYWQLKFDTGEILKSYRLYVSEGRARRYLRDFLIRHYIAPRWEYNVECIEYGESIRSEFYVSPVSESGEYDLTVRGSRLFHPDPDPLPIV